MELEFTLANMCLIIGREISKACKDEWYVSKSTKLILSSYEFDRCFKIGNTTDLFLKLVVVSDCASYLAYLLQMTVLEECVFLEPMIKDALFRVTELLHSLVCLSIQE